MRDAGFLLQCVHCSGNAAHPERDFRIKIALGDLFLGFLAFFFGFVGCRLLFLGFVVGFFLSGTVVGFGQGGSRGLPPYRAARQAQVVDVSDGNH